MDDRKREEYLILVQTSLTALLHKALSSPELTIEAQATQVTRHLIRLSDAVAAADRIPKDATALEAALDVVDYSFNALNGNDTEPDKTWLLDLRSTSAQKHRTAWAGFFARSELLKMHARKFRVERVVDGRARAEDPAWRGLPFDDRLSLDALGWVRSEGKMFLVTLHKQMSRFGLEELHQRLQALAHKDWVKIDEEPDGALTIEANYKLYETGFGIGIKRRLPVPKFATPTERYHARMRAVRPTRLKQIHKEPGARKLLRALARKGEPVPCQELQPLVPHLWALELLQDLRDAGWVETVGRGRGTRWRLTKDAADV